VDNLAATTRYPDRFPGSLTIQALSSNGLSAGFVASADLNAEEYFPAGDDHDWQYAVQGNTINTVQKKGIIDFVMIQWPLDLA
jgi:hypothetical protein